MKDTNNNACNELFTPGHNIYTDTLILHGIVRLLLWSNIENARIERIGERYKIILEEPESLSNKLSFPLSLKIYAQSNAGGNKRELNSLIKKLNKDILFRVFTVRKGKIKRKAGPNTTLKHLEEKIIKFDMKELREVLRDYMCENGITHKEIHEEGREGSKEDKETLYLEFGPIYGKYDFNYSPGRIGTLNERGYRVCEMDIFLSLLGLMYGVFAYKHSAVTTLVLAPYRAELSDLAVYQNMVETASKWQEAKLRARPNSNLTPLAIGLKIFSWGETFFSMDFYYDVITTTIEITKKGQVRVTEFESFSGRKLSDGISIIKYYYPYWPLLLEYIENAEPYLMHRIAEFLLFGGNSYHVFREIVSLTNKSRNIAAYYKNAVSNLEKLAYAFQDLDK